jgi:hypothetical protein
MKSDDNRYEAGEELYRWSNYWNQLDTTKELIAEFFLKEEKTRTSK